MFYDPYGRRRPRRPQVPPQLIERFEAELATARRERDEWADRYEQLLESVTRERERLATEQETFESEVADTRERLKAEVESQRARLQRNAEQRAEGELRSILTRLLEVADNLDRALAQDEGDASPLLDGVRLTQRDFHRALELAGVERLESRGEPFDPARHEAVATRPGEAPSGTILEQMAPGYLYRGALLRPARVIVAE